VRIIPAYKDSKISPFKTNQQLIIEKKEKQTTRTEQQNAKNNILDLKQHIQNQQNDPLLELKINQPLYNQQKPAMPEIYPSPYVPIPNPYYPLGANVGVPWQYTPNNVPIIKRYNISLGNGNGDITKIANLYEDILPSAGNVSLNTFNTLKERLIIHNYIRSIFIKTGDGEELFINGGPNNTKSEIINLLSHVKLLDINPYHYNKSIENPYKTLPNNFVMYRSCYPVKMGNSNVVNCALSSVGMNIRIHLLSKNDELINKNEGITRYQSDIWRELDYYQYIKEEIIKPGLSPNFITLHSYYITKNTGINFKKFDNIRSNFDRNLNIEKSNAVHRNQLYIKYLKKINVDDENYQITMNDLLYHKIIAPTSDINRDVSTDEREKCIHKIIDDKFKNNNLNHLLDSDKCLVMLTEAPTQHIFNWATRTYHSSNGPIKTMIQHGYHDDKVWESLFFQLLISMLIMFEKQITFSEFSLQKNVYIKDLNHGEQNVGIWKYIYNNIEYYVPNHGYLLLIDSNFGDISNTFELDPTDDIKYRICGTILKDSNNEGEIYKLCLDQMINVFSRNNFSNEFTNYGGVAPSQDFLFKLDAIGIVLTEIKQKYLNGIWTDEHKIGLLKDIRKLPLDLTVKNRVFNILHSRIGSKVSENELKYISPTAQFDMTTKPGSICVHSQNEIQNRFVIYVGAGSDEAEAKIITTTTPIYSLEDRVGSQLAFEEVPYSTLKNYYSNVKQYYEPGKQNNILETYLISF